MEIREEIQLKCDFSFVNQCVKVAMNPTDKTEGLHTPTCFLHCKLRVSYFFILYFRYVPSMLQTEFFFNFYFLNLRAILFPLEKYYLYKIWSSFFSFTSTIQT